MSYCRHLENYLERPEIPVEVDSVTGTVRLVIGDDVQIEPLICWFCGGRGDETIPSKFYWRKCKCGILKTLIEQIPEHVEFDERFKEFHIKSSDGGYWLCYFCPACGGQLPRSQRGRYFTKPRWIDIWRVRRTMRQVTSVEDMKRVLGPPTRECQFRNPDDPTTATQFDYVGKWKSLTLFVLEQSNGSIVYSWYRPSLKKIRRNAVIADP